MSTGSSQHRRAKRFGGLCAGAFWLALCGCVDPITQVVLHVQIDEDLRARADSLQVRVGDGQRTSFENTFDLALWGEGSPTVPITNAGPNDTRYLAELTLMAGGEAVALARAQGGFADGGLIERTVTFDAACEGSFLCAGDQTCVAGACQSACEPGDDRCGVCVPPDPVGAGADRTTFDAGGDTTCAIAEGTLYCWGANTFGQAGQPGDAPVQRPARVGDIQDFVAVSVGTQHTCALRESGQLICFGRNDHGQLGYGDTAAHCCNEAVEGRFVAVSAGGEQTCALTADDELFCWGESRLVGRDLEAELPCDDAASPCAPGRVDGAWSQVASGHRFTCALDTTAPARDALHCFGRGAERILGNGSVADVSRPRPIDFSSPSFTLSAGAYAACLLRPTPTSTGYFLECWGSGRIGKLGCDRSNDLIAAPCEVLAEGVMVSVAVGGTLRDGGPGIDGAHLCAVREDGVVLCAGPNSSAQAGSGGDPRVPIDDVLAPNEELGLMQALTAGAAHTCGVAEDGTLLCWGNSESGQLGRGVSGAVNGPRAVCLGSQ